MVVAWQPIQLRNALVFFGAFQDATAIELAHQATLDFLPGSLGGRIRVTPFGQQVLASLFQLGVCYQKLSLTAIQVDAQSVAGSDQREASVDGRFR